MTNDVNTHSRCETCPASRYGVCLDLKIADIQKLRQIEFRRVVAPGSAIISEGETADQFGTIVGGVVKLSKRLDDGRQQIVAFLFPCDFVGRPFAPSSPFTAEAIGEVEMFSYRRAPFETLLRGAPGIEHNLLGLVLSELDAAHNWMLLLGRKTAREKVASLLLLFARRNGRRGSDAGRPNERTPFIATSMVFDLPLSRGEMADCLGLRLETVSRQVGRLVAEGVVRLDGRHTVIVPDIARLRANSEARSGD